MGGRCWNNTSWIGKYIQNPFFCSEWLLNPTFPDYHPYLLAPQSGDHAQLPESFELSGSSIIPVLAKTPHNFIHPTPQTHFKVIPSRLPEMTLKAF